MNRRPILQTFSTISSVPGLRLLSPAATARPDSATLASYLNAQRLAEQGAREIASFITEGWSEQQAAMLLDTWLRDNGVKSFFHYSFAWFGERTRFEGINIRNYWEFRASERVLQPGEVYILDVAPIVDGYICDIGYTACLGENAEYRAAMAYLRELRDLIPQLFKTQKKGGEIWHEVDRRIREKGYDNIHRFYPYSVIGHRVHRVPETRLNPRLLNFGWQSYWSLLSRGLFGQLLNGDFSGSLNGLWAIEPHIGTTAFGAKFEEILVVDGSDVRWLEPDPREL